MNVDRLFFHLILMEIRILRRIQQLEIKMSKELDDLKAAVAAEDTVIASAITLLGGIKAALDAAIAANDPAALKALSDDVGARTAELSAAVAANTPAAP